MKTSLPSPTILLGGILLTGAMAATHLRAAAATPVAFQDVPFPVIERFENFGQEQGIPHYKVHAVLKTSDGQLWIGTYNGLCVRQADGTFKRYGPEDGLSHKMAMCLAEDTNTGDLWVGTMRGLNRVSGGKIASYTQTSSGLPNNVVYGVDVVGDSVWAATAAGTGAMNLKTGEWKIYDHNNSIMHEPWCYSLTHSNTKIYIGVWGGGVVEHDPRTGSFKEYRDPDGDFHFILVPDSGPINDITSWVAWEDGVLWQCTYFGLSRYDGHGWKTWVEGKSPLLSNFTQFVVGRHRVGWIGSDKGLSVTDGTTWVNYEVGEHGEGVRTIVRPGQPPQVTKLDTALADGFVLGIYVDDDEAWFGTSHGLSRGVFAPYKKPATVAATQP